MKIGIYGGTFSPVHNGHVRAAKLFMEAAMLDRLIIMPAGIPPHKADKLPISAAVRLEMCRAAFGEMSEKIEVSDFEINKSGSSYTVETVEHYLGEGDICVLCGEDMICSLDTWHRASELMQMCSFYGIAREKKERIFSAVKRLEAEYGADITVIEAEPLRVSSTEIRHSVKNGEDVSALVPARVYEIIKKYKLYR